MNLDPRTVVILTVLSTLLMSISLFAVARGYLSQMRGVTRWASGTLLQSTGWILLAMLGVIPSYIAELGSPLIMLGLALYHHSLVAFKELQVRVRWVYVVVILNVLAIYFFLLVVPNMAARIVVASGTGAVLMFFSAKVLFSDRLNKLPISHVLTGFLFAVCSLVLSIRAIYYLLWNTAPDQSAFEHNLIQDIAFLTFFLAGVVSSFTFILMCNDRYNDESLLRTQELAKKNQELEEASQAKGQFLATMSHEIRTPLNGVIGFLSQLGKTRLDEQQKDYLHTINLSARFLMSVINDVLDYSKIDAGKLSIEGIPVNLRSYLEDTASMFAANAEVKGIDLVCIVDHRIREGVISDPVRLTQIISNLLGNAIKFTEQGEVKLEAKLLRDSGTHLQLEISVSDTGIGISQFALEKLFQPFIQADASTTRKYGGTGLGLVIARKIVEMMGGAMRVESEEGQGTRFHINLELQKSAGQVEKPGYANLSGIAMLMVTPNRSLARGMGEDLAVLGIHASTASSGDAALKLLATARAEGRNYDAVLVDRALNDMTAEDFACAWGQSAGKNESRLILLDESNCCEQSDLPKVSGYEYCLQKPLKLADLHLMLAKWFDPEFFANNFAASTVQAALPLARPLLSRRVLIVDDNQINLKLMQMLVSELGGEFDLAENGEQAVNACRSGKYDLVLMDINMPVMDGPEATRRIREFESDRCHTPIIALTANALPGDRERYLGIGMDDYLTKPLSEKALLAVAEKWCAGNPVAGADAGKQNQMDSSAIDDNIFNPSLGVKLSFGDVDTWHMVLGLLLDELPEYVRKFSSIPENDLEQLAFLSHKLAGSSCYCGTPALNLAARNVEIYCTDTTIDQLLEALAELKFQMKNLMRLDTAGLLRKANVSVT